MTFALIVRKKDQPCVVGMLWAEDEAKARVLACSFCHLNDEEQVTVCRTESREIPFVLSDGPRMQFC